MKKFNVKKILTVILISLIAAILAGIYGIIHDHITYAISPEYYTKFKFIQFDLVNKQDERMVHPRIFVTVVGFLATWWFGLILGSILGLYNLIQSTWQKMIFISFKSILISILVSFLIGIMGLIFGFLFLSKQPKSSFEGWFFPEDLQNFGDYIAVGSMHNFGYIGGIIGLIVGIFYSYKKRG